MSLSPLLSLWRRSDCAFLCAGLAAAFLVAGRAQEPPSAAGLAQVITQYDQFWDLPGDAQAALHPIDLELDVVHVDQPWYMLFFESATELHYMRLPERDLGLRAGQRVRVTGMLSPLAGFSEELLEFEVLGESPRRERPRFEELPASALERPQIVRLSALVNRQEMMDENHLFLELAHQGMVVGARIFLPSDSVVPQLENAFVELRALYNPKRGAMHAAIAFEFLVARASDIVVTDWLARHPGFERPVITIEQLANVAEGSLVRVEGQVRAQSPGTSLTVRDATGQVEVLTGQSGVLPLGSWAEVIGQPRIVDGAWRLADGYYRALGQPPPPLESLGLSHLRMIDHVLDLSESEARLGHPVHLNGTVMWSHPAAAHLFLLDPTGGVRVELSPGLIAPRPGEILAIKGRSQLGAYAPEVVATHLELLGDRALPKAREVTLEHALTGMEEGQWVMLHGYVRQVAAEGLWTRLEITTPSGELHAYAPADPGLSDHVGAIVRVRGVCTAIANERRQLTGIRLWLPSSAEVQVEEAPSADPFAGPLAAIGDLRRFTTLQTANRRVRLAGTLVYHLPGRYLVLQEGLDALVVLSRKGGRLAPGDRVEVVGLPGTDQQKTVLREAVFRRLAGGPVPVPQRLKVGGGADPALESRLVQVAARVLQVTPGPPTTRLVLEAEGTTFEARLEGTASVGEVGSRLALTGIYTVVYDEYRQPRGFVLQLRSPADITVLERAAWLTPQRALAVVGLLVLMLAAGLGWVASLRRRVREQTAQLRVQLTKEAELKAQQQDIMVSASDFIFTIDLSGRFTGFNPAGERLIGYAQAEAGTVNLRDLLVDASVLFDEDGCLRAQQTNDLTFETQLKARDGRVVWVEISAHFIADQGRTSGVLGIVRDISGRKEFEERLAAARDAAEASARAKSVFLASMSHEIRTPMNGVIGMCNLLMDTRLSEEQQDFATTIRESAESLLTVLNDVLDFSKIEAGKMDFEQVPFDVTEMVEGTLDLLAARAVAKNLEFASFVPDSVPRMVVGDSGRLRQVLLNLVSNAIKFTEHGEVVTSVSCEPGAGDVVVLRFEVTDTGIGLSQEEQDRLFQPFTQADSTTTRRFGGTGLGLAICKQIAELMGGEVGVRSAKGEGATFWFTARLAQAQADSESSPSTVMAGSLAGRRVLTVDDNATNRRIIEYYVNAAGMTAVVANSAEQALQLTREAIAAGQPFDFGLLDYQMPNADGLELAAQLVALREDARPRLLLLTSLDRRFSSDEAEAAQLDRVLRKPIHRDELLGAMRASLARLTSESGASDLMPLTVRSGPVYDEREITPTGLRALVVEDNVVNQRVARLLLERIGVRSELAANGLEAIEAIERIPYDVVLMDCQMPEMDGYEATRRIRAAGRHPGLRIIAMTANAMQGDRERCLEAGMDDYISKPMRPVELRAALERCRLQLNPVV